MATKITIFLVEDNEIEIALVKTAFSKFKNTNFYSFKSAEEAFSNMKALKPDVLIVDHNLGSSEGQMSGLDFVKEIRNKNKKKKAKIIFFTSSVRADVYSNAVENGVHEYVIKGEPDSVLRLVNTVKHIKKLKKARRQRKVANMVAYGLVAAVVAIIVLAFIFGDRKII